MLYDLQVFNTMRITIFAHGVEACPRFHYKGYRARERSIAMDVIGDLSGNLVSLHLFVGRQLHFQHRWYLARARRGLRFAPT
jgi:hypothetical protein